MYESEFKENILISKMNNKTMAYDAILFHGRV